MHVLRCGEVIGSVVEYDVAGDELFILMRCCRLSFCDLAGSERYTKTQNTGERLKEASHINTSLLTLGRCMQVLRLNQQASR